MSEPVIIGNATLYLGDCAQVLSALPAESVQCCVTSPPYFGLRDYGHAEQIGLEETPEQYIAKLVQVFREVRSVLRADGTLWLNIGDSYATDPKGPDGGMSTSGLAGGGGYQHKSTPPGLGKWSYRQSGYKRKDLIGIPWMLVFALRADGWYLRQDIIWHKPNPMPESVTDRCTKAHEYLFLLSKSERYFFDADAVREPHVRIWDEKNGGNLADVGHKKNGKIETRQTHPNGYPLPNPLGRNRRSVWTVATQPYAGAHFTTFPPDLIKPCILAGSRPGDSVLDPFNGSGTTGAVSLGLGRHYLGVELNPDYLDLSVERITPAARQPDMFHAPVEPKPSPRAEQVSLFDAA